MDSLGSVAGSNLRILCRPCRREGLYRLAELVAEHGADASLETVRRLLSRDCRWQIGPREREPGKYVPKCQARLILPDTRASGGFDMFRAGSAVFRIDVWDDVTEGIDVEVLLTTDLSLARKWFEDVAEKYPNRLVTLRKQAWVILSTRKRLLHGTGGW